MGKRKQYNGTHDVRRVLIRRDGSVCHYCPTSMSLTKRDSPPEPHTMTLEHVVPESKGGPSTADNLVLACSECNQKMDNQVFKCECNFCVRARNRYYVVVL